MTEKELLNYYKRTKTPQDEITLIGGNTGIRYIFRHYREHITLKDKWLHPITDEIYDTSTLIQYYDIPNSYNIFLSLEIGDIIKTLNKHDSVFYYKKIDDDAFIQCDSDGHFDINKEPYIGYFLYDHKEIIEFSSCYEKYKEGII